MQDMEIGPGWVRLMARYSAWQNGAQINAADPLGEAARRADRSAFFGSIMATMSHVLWADRTWLSRFGVGAAPTGGIKGSVSLHDDWEALKAARQAEDAALSGWAAGLERQDIAGDLHWFSGALGREVTRPRALVVTHLFNHQTHHRGQIHAMLTAAGARPADTDLFAMPALETA